MCSAIKKPDILVNEGVGGVHNVVLDVARLVKE